MLLHHESLSVLYADILVGPSHPERVLTEVAVEDNLPFEYKAIMTRLDSTMKDEAMYAHLLLYNFQLTGKL